MKEKNVYDMCFLAVAKKILIFKVLSYNNVFQNCLQKIVQN